MTRKRKKRERDEEDKKGKKEVEEDNIREDKTIRKKEKTRTNKEKNKDGKLIALQYQQRILFLQCVYPCRTGGVPGGTACCIETSQRLSGALRVDNYTAQTFASWSRRGEEMTPQGADGLELKWFPQTVANWNRHGNCRTKDRQKRNFGGMIWTREEGNKKSSLKKNENKLQAQCINRQEPVRFLQCVC